MFVLIVVLVSVGLATTATIAMIAGRCSSMQRGSSVDDPPSTTSTSQPRERSTEGPRRAARPHVREPQPPTRPSETTLTDEAIGVTRREFFNRSLLALVGFALAGAGTAVLAFLWPQGGSSEGFGGKIAVTGLSKILIQIEQESAPFYVPAARTWLQRYPASALPNAEKVYKPVVVAGMKRGVVALYQRCPHLGCRVPWCQTSQWFECPCHGSKYNAVGEKKAGPAPRGMDRFGIAFNGDNITIDTETVILGPPVGTNTTGQNAAGPLCV